MTRDNARFRLAQVEEETPNKHFLKVTFHKYRLYGESMEIRDLETRGPWAVASERSEDATKGPRVSKSRISIGRAV